MPLVRRAGQVAAVDPDGPDRRLDRGGMANAFGRVVGIDQQGRVFREDAREGRERLAFGRERLDP